MLEYNLSLLKSKITAVCGSNKSFAKAIGISEIELFRKLHNQSEFMQNEIENAVEVLGLKGFEIQSCFFTVKELLWAA